MVRQLQNDHTSPRGELLREIGASHTRSFHGDEASKELLRLAADPLLLHHFVQRGQQALATSHEKTKIGMLPFVITTPSDQSNVSRPVYGAPETLLPPSVTAEAFDPTEEDCERAININPQPEFPKAIAVPTSPWLTLPALVTVLFLLLLVFS